MNAVSVVAALCPEAAILAYASGLALQRVRRPVPRSFLLAAGVWAVAAFVQAWLATRGEPWTPGEILAVLVALTGLLLDWVALLTLRRSEGLVTEGVYRLSRHPQHLGVLLLLAGPFLWPFPPLAVLVGWTAWRWLGEAGRIEERKFLADPVTGKAYEKYMRRVPFGVSWESLAAFLGRGGDGGDGA